MKIALFYHSLLSDWNHGNAHFLRGISWELQQRGHDVDVFEPADGWSLKQLLAAHGRAPIDEFYRTFPGLRSNFYHPNTIDVDEVLRNVDLVIVHEWSERDLVGKIAAHHRRHRDYCLLFHDTHHRAVTEPDSMAGYDLSAFDGVLAFGNAVAEIYRSRKWARRVWVWHEAADSRTFGPLPNTPKEGDLIWIGNWGDDERTAELHEFLLEPVRSLGLKAHVYGVRYPADALRALADAGIHYGGWLPNLRVPQMFARFRVTVHVPRRPYVRSLPGIPTIRPFEALACAIPLVCAPWHDSEKLFNAGRDYLVAANSAQMKSSLERILQDQETAQRLAAHGRETILQRHTCAHRVDELLEIYRTMMSSEGPSKPAGLREQRL